MSEDGSVRIVATGSAWIGKGIGSVATAVEQLVADSKEEIQIASYALGESNGFFHSLEGCLSRGVRVQMIVNKLDTQPEYAYDYLHKLKSRFTYFDLLNFSPPESEDLHAKVLVADRSNAIVGSANPSWRGLFKNHELALVISGEAATRIADLLDILARSRYCVRVEA